jgi:hypothetical protein
MKPVIEADSSQVLDTVWSKNKPRNHDGDMRNTNETLLTFWFDFKFGRSILSFVQMTPVKRDEFLFWAILRKIPVENNVFCLL